MVLPAPLSMTPSLSQPKHKLRVPRPKKGRVRLLVGTRKGAFVVGSDAERKEFDVVGTEGLGTIVHHVVVQVSNHANFYRFM